LLLSPAAQIVEIPLPWTRKGRLQVLRIHTQRMRLAGDVDLPRVARGSGGLSGAELAAVCREAALAALREDMGAVHVKMRHFEAAFGAIQRDVRGAVLSSYTAQYSTVLCILHFMAECIVV